MVGEDEMLHGVDTERSERAQHDRQDIPGVARSLPIVMLSEAKHLYARRERPSLRSGWHSLVTLPENYKPFRPARTIILPINPPKAANNGKTAAATSQRLRKSTGTMSGGDAITLLINQL